MLLFSKTSFVTCSTGTCERLLQIPLSHHASGAEGGNTGGLPPAGKTLVAEVCFSGFVVCRDPYTAQV